MLARVKPDYSEAMLRKNRFRLDHIPDEYMHKRILIIGDAQMVESAYLKDKGFTNVVSSERDYPFGLQLSFDIEDEFLDQKFDLIYCSHVLEHCMSAYKALHNLKMMLNGELMIFVPAEEDCWIEDYHISCFTSNGWHNLIKRVGLRLLESKEFKNNDRNEYYFKVSI